MPGVRSALWFCPDGKNLSFRFGWKLEQLFCFKILWEIYLHHEYNVKKCQQKLSPSRNDFLEQPVVALQFSSSQLPAGAVCTSTLRRLESHWELFFFPIYLTCSAVSAHYGHYELLLLIMLLGRWHLDLLNWCWWGWKNLSSQIQIFCYNQKGS